MNAVLGLKPTPDFFRLLTQEDLTALADPDEFLAEAGLEEKLMLLSRLGYPFVLVIGTPQKKMAKPVIERVVSLFFRMLSWKRIGAVKVLRERHLFMLSDLDIVKSLRLAANIYQSPSSAAVAGYSVVANKMYNYSRKDQRDMLRDQSAGHEIDSVIIEAIRLTAMDQVHKVFMNIYGLAAYQYMILAALSKGRELGLGDIVKLTGAHAVKRHLQVLMQKSMVANKLVVVNNRNQVHYIITGYGEQVLIKARTYFIKNL